MVFSRESSTWKGEGETASATAAYPPRLSPKCQWPGDGRNSFFTFYFLYFLRWAADKENKTSQPLDAHQPRPMETSNAGTMRPDCYIQTQRISYLEVNMYADCELAFHRDQSRFQNNITRETDKPQWVHNYPQLSNTFARPVCRLEPNHKVPRGLLMTSTSGDLQFCASPTRL